MWVKEEEKEIKLLNPGKSQGQRAWRLWSLICISCCCRQPYLPVLLEMCQDLGISVQILLEGLPELSLILVLKEEKSKSENCWDLVQTTLKTGEMQWLKRWSDKGHFNSADCVKGTLRLCKLKEGFLCMCLLWNQISCVYVLRYCPTNDVYGQFFRVVKTEGRALLKLLGNVQKARFPLRKQLRCWLGFTGFICRCRGCVVSKLHHHCSCLPCFSPPWGTMLKTHIKTRGKKILVGKFIQWLGLDT